MKIRRSSYRNAGHLLITAVSAVAVKAGRAGGPHRRGRHSRPTWRWCSWASDRSCGRRMVSAPIPPWAPARSCGLRAPLRLEISPARGLSCELASRTGAASREPTVARTGRRGGRPRRRPALRRATTSRGTSCNKSCNNSRSARVNVRFARSLELLHELWHDGLSATAGNGKTAGHKPVTCGFGRWPGAGSNRRPSDFQSDARTN